MKTLLAWGLVLGTSLAGTTWARQASAAPVTDRFTSADSTSRIFTVETTTDRITFKTHDADRIDVLSGEASEGGALSTNRPQPLRSRVPRQLLGVSLIAMVGTAVGLRARRHRTLHGGRELVDDINESHLLNGS